MLHGTQREGGACLSRLPRGCRARGFGRGQTTGAHKIVIECLGNLDQMPTTGATLVLGILRLKDGSGTPLSVMAFVP